MRWSLRSTNRVAECLGRVVAKGMQCSVRFSGIDCSPVRVYRAAVQMCTAVRGFGWSL